MRLERLPECISIVIVACVGTGLALYCGQHSGSDQTTMPLAIMGGIVAMMFALWQRVNLWLLIPMCWGLAGQTASLPVRDVVIVYVFVVYLAFRALKVIRAKHTYNWLDMLLLINIIYVGLAYIRNPVGVEAFGSEKVAGRPYLEIIFAMCAYWVIGYVTITGDLARKLPWLSSSSYFFAGFLCFITSTFPSTTPILSKIYSGIDASVYNAHENFDAETQRAQYLNPLSISIFKTLFSYFPPLSLFNPANFIRFCLFVTAFIFALKSGHRTAILHFFTAIAIFSYFWNGVRELIKLTAILVPVLACIIVFNGELFDLPVPVQRALCFLPGNWDNRAKEDAEGSSEWRFEMWRFVWASDKYIHDRWFGDGFGITRRQLYEGFMLQNRSLEENSGRENLAIVGDFHSGPLSSIRFVGFVGFALYMVLLFGMAAYAYRLIIRSKNTPFFGLALFFGAPLMFEPVDFILIFGDYKEVIPNALFTVAMLTLTDRSLTAWQEQMHAKKTKAAQASQIPSFTGALYVRHGDRL